MSDDAARARDVLAIELEARGRKVAANEVRAGWTPGFVGVTDFYEAAIAAITSTFAAPAQRPPLDAATVEEGSYRRRYKGTPPMTDTDSVTVEYDAITMQDVRLAMGEGKLSPGDVLWGCNATLRRRLAASPAVREDVEALEQALGLIQEAKGLADGPQGGAVTDHLDFAEHWINKALAAKPSQDEAMRVAKSFTLEWLAEARPPIHPTEMVGRQDFPTFDAAVSFLNRRAAHAKFVSLTETTRRSFDRSEDARAALTKDEPDVE